MMTMINGHYVESIGAGFPIVCIHPPHMGLAVFKYQRLLSDKANVILYDIRGQGRSPNNKREKVTIRSLADDLKGILDELNIEKAVLFGYSNGGSIGLDFSIRYPDRVKALVLSGGFSEVSTFVLKREFQIGIGIASLGMNKLLSMILAQSHRITKGDKRELYQYALKSNIKTTKQIYVDGKNYISTSHLHKLKSPVYLVYGSKDDYVHRYLRKFRKMVPHCKPIIIANATHQIPTKHYKELNQIITTIL